MNRGHMKRHEEFERILASYRDATPQEQARAAVHLQGCPQCAARWAAFDGVDTAVGRLSQPALPLSLRQSLAALINGNARNDPTARPSSGALAFTFRSLAPAGLILFVAVALSVFLWSANLGRTPATTTPTLTTTMTLTPTTISTRQTDVVGFGALPVQLSPDFMAEPTPAPMPAPAARPSGAQSRLILVGYAPRATITN